MERMLKANPITEREQYIADNHRRHNGEVTVGYDFPIREKHRTRRKGGHNDRDKWRSGQMGNSK
jgi:hypothetical protein